MRSPKFLYLLPFLLISSSAFAAELCGPDYQPPFEVKEVKRQPPRLVIQNFLDKSQSNKPADAASLDVGNKRIALRESAYKALTSQRDGEITIYVNNKPVCCIILAGGYEGPDQKNIRFTQGYKPEEVKLICDSASNTVSWNRNYPLPDGAQGSFSYQLKPIGGSQVELSWDVGCSDTQMVAANIKNVLIRFSLAEAYRTAGVEINGLALKQQSDEALGAADQKGVEVWRGQVEKLVYNPAKSLNGFSLILPEAPAAIFTEKFSKSRITKKYALGFQANFKPRGKLVIDLGESAVVRQDAPPAVEGNDLWTQDALHLPKSPTRNLFPNPSFEQGLRYWRWMGGGAIYSRSDIPRYGVDNTAGLFGKSALVVNPTQQGSAALKSFSLPGKKGQIYTVSFYAKGEKPGAGAKIILLSTKDGGKFGRSNAPMEKLTSDWQRFSQTFVSDGAPIALVIGVENNGGKVWLDGIQYEAGDKATDFVSAPIEGRLFTSDPDGNVEYGKKIGAAFELYGKDGTAGVMEFTLCDFFKKTVWQKAFNVQSGQRFTLPFDDLKLAKGAYILRVKYTLPGIEPYFDFYRFTLIDSLDGTQATKNLYGALFMSRISRTEDLCELMRRCGYGASTSYGPGNREPGHYELRKKFGIADYTHTLTNLVWYTEDEYRNRHNDPDCQFLRSIDMRLDFHSTKAPKVELKERYSEEDAQRMEDIACRAAAATPEARVWSLATEEEISIPSLIKRRDYKEFAKLQIAFYRGIKKGNPNAIVLPSGGTSGYGKIRGKDNIEGYLAATQGQAKWDAVAVHPYGSCDGTLGQDDLDDNTQMLVDSMAKYGYGKETPIFYNEGGAQGSPARWGDGPDYTYHGGQPSYDQGLREFLHACKTARQYIICLKYWPKVEHFNCWLDYQSEVVDYNLTPAPAMLGINTLGHLLAKPTFIADLRPAPGMRGYAFKDDKGNGVAAVWCTLDNVELGIERGPEMRVKFAGEKLPELFDLMGKSYPLTADKDGYVNIRLTPAPLFIRSASPEKLAAALKDAEVSGAGTSVTASFLPTLAGKIAGKLQNLTGRKQTGELEVDGQKGGFELEPMKAAKLSLAKGITPEFGKIFHWNNAYTVTLNGKPEPEKNWKMDYFYVPKVSGGRPEWEKIPAIAITNLYRPVVNFKQTPGGHPGDIKASFKAAWDEKNFYLRVEADDDIFNPNDLKFWSTPEFQKNSLYMIDGSLEVYFDCGANGRLRSGGLDLDDYRYDFCTNNPEGKSGPGLVNRLHEVYTEYAGGCDMPGKEEAAKGIKCEFERVSPTRYVYTITFAQKYIEPLRLQKGSVAGFGLFLQDKMDDGTPGGKGLSLATEPGADCNEKPQLWPLMVLSE